MARPREAPSTTPDAETSTEAQLSEREGEAQVQAEEQQEAAKAEERRERQQDRAADLKSVPEGALAPTEKQSGGDTVYAQQWLIDNAEDVLGYPSHVAAGALHFVEDEYLGIEEAKRHIEKWLESPDSTPTRAEGEEA